MITFLSFIFTLFLFFTLHTKTKYYYFYYLSPKTTRPSNRKKEDVNGNCVAATASILKISIKTSALKSINFPSFASTTAVIFFLWHVWVHTHSNTVVVVIILVKMEKEKGQLWKRNFCNKTDKRSKRTFVQGLSKSSFFSFVQIVTAHNF